VAQPAGSEHDVVTILTRDHREVEELFAQIAALGPGDFRARERADRVVRLLVRHAEAEEAYLYPAFRRLVPGGDALADRELSEHSAAERSMKQLERTRADDPRFQIRLRMLMAEVRHHVAEEEGELFPLLVEHTSPADRETLGRAVQAVKRIGPTRPHPSSPDHPPLNLLLGPGLGLVDRLRDAVSGRGGGSD
jgi:hemerythrin superfamily protein